MTCDFRRSFTTSFSPFNDESYSLIVHMVTKFYFVALKYTKSNGVSFNSFILNFIHQYAPCLMVSFLYLYSFWVLCTNIHHV